MRRVYEPSGAAMRGKILNMLRLAGRYGLPLEKIKAAGFRSQQVVHSAIHGLRTMGHRIDFEGGRYIARGHGVSFTQFRKGCKPLPVAVTKRVKVLAKIDKASHVVTRAPQAMTRRVAAGRDVFLVNPGVLQRALKVLPADARTGILEVTKRARQYNEAVRLFSKAHQTAQGILQIGE